MRDIPALLLAHLQQPVTTTCRLLKITLRDGTTSFGFTTLDQSIAYDDGDGELAYTATNSFDQSAFSSDSSYSLDNAEGTMLISDDVSPDVTIDMINRGALDDARWVCYLINFLDTSMGHVILDAGDVGQVRTRFGMVWLPELLSYAVRLRQPIGRVDSRTCRAIFGSDADSQHGCGYDAESLWATGTVVSVGVESDRAFTGDVTETSFSVDPFPGRVEWLTGSNAGMTLWTDSFDAGAVELGEPTPYPIQAGDTFRIRPDCRKRYQEDCIATWDNGINFKGEPLIPVGDAGAGQTPGAQVPGSAYVGRALRPAT